MSSKIPNITNAAIRKKFVKMLEKKDFSKENLEGLKQILTPESFAEIENIRLNIELKCLNLQQHDKHFIPFRELTWFEQTVLDSILYDYTEKLLDTYCKKY